MSQPGAADELRGVGVREHDEEDDVDQERDDAQHDEDAGGLSRNAISPAARPISSPTPTSDNRAHS